MNYLSPQEILYIHNQIVDELGGKHGAKDIILLKRTVKYTHDAEIFPDKLSKAAALLFGIAKKKPFSERNLETAIAVMQIFLNINRTDLDISYPAFQSFIKKDLPKSKVEDIRKFLVQNTMPIS